MKQMKYVHTPQQSNMGIPVLGTPTVMLSQSNEYWFAHKVDKCYFREEVSLS